MWTCVYNLILILPKLVLDERLYVWNSNQESKGLELIRQI